MNVSPEPSFAWQVAQWSAQWARASASTSGVFGAGLARAQAPFGRAAERAQRATRVSIGVGWPLALKPLPFRKRRAAASTATAMQENPPRTNQRRRVMLLPPPRGYRQSG